MPAEDQRLAAKLIIIILLATVLGGCLMGPDYRRPQLDIPQSFQYSDKEAAQTADSEWWKGFQDPVLDQLIADALANNKNVKIAAANIQAAAGLLTETRAPLFPQVNYGGAAGRHRVSDQSSGGAPNPSDFLQVFSGVNWELDLWGRVRRLSEAARANLFASEEARRGIILSLVATVAENYMRLRGLDEQLLITRNSLAAYEESVRLYTLQFNQGLVSQLVVEQARIQYETAAVVIPRVEAQIVQTENVLSVLLGKNPTGIPRGRTLSQLTFPLIPAGLPSQLLERRPDLAQAEQNLIAANARIGAAKALYFPTISLTGNFGFESRYLSDLFKSGSRTWNFAGSFLGPIFTAGAISGQVEQAEADQKAALLAYEAAIQSAFADVENALVVRQKLVTEIESQNRLVDASRNYERLAKLQYEGGYAPYLTVLDAQQKLFPAELDLTQLRVALLAAYANLYKAMGGGWVGIADQMTGAAPVQPTGGIKW